MVPTGIPQAYINNQVGVGEVITAVGTDIQRVIRIQSTGCF
jgi:hypothetical protein